ncbi:hypothetical protein Vadar_032080 [Vaccinium darrowii]|uniref:Uncharacterized protein n=1 Tax=Vaccinium darrowii TaxID=229202 RepID=A0ACB7ZNV6_9ERIC|nr:hypothetical protein Vadar_032080 [Vaccinium darrowii]
MFQLPLPPSVMCPISSQIERDEEVEEVGSGDNVEEDEVTNGSPVNEGGDEFCNGGITSGYVRNDDLSLDMPLDSDVFRVPPGYNATSSDIDISNGLSD